jgi:hypothetical protein
VIVGQHDSDRFVLFCQFVLLARGLLLMLRQFPALRGRGEKPRRSGELFHTTGGDAMGKTQGFHGLKDGVAGGFLLLDA